MVHPHERSVVVRGCAVPLTTREYGIVERLAEHPGWVFSADQLSSDGDIGAYSPESVSVIISRLRRKLARAGAPGAVETVRGMGYRIRTVSDESPEAPGGESSSLRDAAWRLQETVIEVEHTADPDLQRRAATALEDVRATIRIALRHS